MTPKRYLQVCVEAQNGTDGPGLALIVQRVLAVFSSTWVVVSDVDLVGSARESLLTRADDVLILPIVKLITLLEQAKQVVWATIFLCPSRPAAEEITGYEDYVSALSKADAVVRVVDAGYYYVYGPLERMDELRDKLTGEQKEGLAEELDFPE